MGINLSTNNENLDRLHSRFRIIAKEQDQSVIYLADKRNGAEFILREIVSNQEKQTAVIERLVDEKTHNRSQYIVRLNEYIFQKSTNYCSYELKTYLIFSKPYKTIRTDIMERKVRGGGYREDELMKILEAGTQGLRYLKEIGHEHSAINSSNIFIEKTGEVVISDPWMNPQFYTVTEHNYDSPQKLEQKISIKQQQVDWFSSSLFSLGMVILECIELNYMDDLYQKGRGINYSKLNAKLSAIKYPRVRSYLEGLLGSPHQRLFIIHQIEAFIVSLQHKHSAEFPTIQKNSGKIQLSRNHSLPNIRDSNYIIPEVKYETNTTQQSKVQNVSMKNQIKEQYHKIQSIPPLNNSFKKVSHPIIVQKEKKVIPNNIPPQKHNHEIQIQKIDRNSRILGNKTISFVDPAKNTNVIKNINLQHSFSKPPTYPIRTQNGAFTERTHEPKTVYHSYQKRKSIVQDRQVPINNFSFQNQKNISSKDLVHKSINRQQKQTLKLPQQNLKYQNFTNRATTDSSMIKSSNLVSSMAQLKPNIQTQQSTVVEPTASKVYNSHHYYPQTILTYEQTPSVPTTLEINKVQDSLSPFSSSYVPKYFDTSSKQYNYTTLNVASTSLTKQFSFAPISPQKSLSMSYGTSHTGVQSAYIPTTKSKQQIISQNKAFIQTLQKQKQKQKQKDQLADLQYQIKFQNSKSKDQQELSFSHINNITKQLKMQFQDENISTIEPNHRDTIRTPERNSDNKVHINPFQQQDQSKQYKSMEGQSMELENVRNIVSFQEKKERQPRKYNSTIIEISDEQKSVTSNAETQFVTEQYQIGSKYQGFKKNGMRNGLGVFMYKDGGHYEGHWKDNQMHGAGKLFYPSTQLAYDGQWYADQFHGKGKVYNDISNITDIPNTPFDYTNLNQLQDVWQFYDGSLYKDKKHGYGIIKFLNGQIFQGQFKDDKMEGKGKFITLSGKIIQGTWRNSQLIEQSI